jgi:tRNA threonylcarbamoyladenosine biosynthesis protein TsaE
MEYKTTSEQELIDLGNQIAENFKPGDIVLLYGDLGAGKTTMTKGIARYFGIGDIVSPTFTLMQTYPEQNFVHIDTYRLEDEEDLVEIGAEDYLGEKNTICIIEWPEKIEGLLKNKKTVKITIEHDENGRKIKIED